MAARRPLETSPDKAPVFVEAESTERSEVSRRSLVIAATGLTVVTAVLLPFAHQQLGYTVSFMPAMLAVVACFDVMSVYLLVGDYRDRGDLRLLMMSLAYSWSLVLMGAYASAFPGAVAVNPPLAVTPSMAPYFYVLWHAGFPVLLGVAWAPWPAHWTAPTPVNRRRVVAAIALTVSILSGLATIVLFVATANRLPVLINGLDTSRMTSVTAPLAVPLTILALISTVHGTRHRAGPERWCTIAALVCLCDLILTYNAATRYSLGWYSGRTLTLVAAAVVLVAMLGAFQRVKAQAEYDAATDPLTGLQNRRSAYQALEQMVARCRRSGAPLGVLSLDLDLFKLVNDRYGHEVGDTVLTEVGQLLTRSCRRGDVVARVGGEEFMMLLPDSDQGGTAIVAEKVRALIQAQPISPSLITMTVSVGAASFHVEDPDAATMLRRSDNALYQAKAAGRNRVVTAVARIGAGHLR